MAMAPGPGQNSQFSAPAISSSWMEDAPDQFMNYSFSQVFDTRDSLNEAPHNVSTPSSVTFASPTQSAPMRTSTEVHFPPLQQDFRWSGNGQSTQSHQRTMGPPAKPPNSNRRISTATLSQADWEKHHDELQRLWIDEDNSLNATMKVMAERFQFKPSMEQYKKQFKKWNWSKNLHTAKAAWMKNKAEKRKREEKKDTIFEFRGQKHTRESLQQRFEGKESQLEQADIAADAPTPAGMTYTTPGNDASSPLYIAPPPTSSRQDRLTAAPTSHVQRPHQLGLIWNGRTKADFEALYQEAQEQERLGRVDDAEEKFRETLAGFENLLSPTHEDTNAVAYRLASFYAQNDRMKDADTVLDRITRNHIESFGIKHQKTGDHLSNVVDMFRNWSRTKDATTFLLRIIDASLKPVQDTPDNAPHLHNSDSFATSNRSDVRHTRSTPSQPHPVAHPTATIETSEPAVINCQLGIAKAYIKASDETAEPLLLRLIEQCEKQPNRLAAQALRCRSELLTIHSVQGGDKMNKSLDQAQQAFWKILDSEQEKTESLLEACVELAKWHVKLGRYQSADDMFIQIQSEAVDFFGADDEKTIAILERIGLLYQREGRWDDAEPRFEQALIACYTAFGESSEHAKGLEKGLENQFYEIYCPLRKEVESALRKAYRR